MVFSDVFYSLSNSVDDCRIRLLSMIVLTAMLGVGGGWERFGEVVIRSSDNARENPEYA